ncbi:MAG TPA: ergothioneine biosynthesis glutamate--cysteine ligase EgtA [Acidimicrobiales bacterium]
MPTPTRHLDLDRVQVLVRERCFPASTAALVGAEIEWLSHSLQSDHDLGCGEVEAALDGATALPGGSSLTFEPGGQVELSSAAFTGVTDACRALGRDASAVRAALAEHDIELVGMGLDPLRPPRRVVDGPRYQAMEAFFDADSSGGHAGPTMMCNTAAVQVNLDIGAPDAIGRRWRLAHALGPVLVSSFANSPLAAGRPTGWCSTRMATWLGIDPSRTSPVSQDEGWADAWVDYAMAAKVMLIRRSPDDFVPVRSGLSFGEWMATGHELGYPTMSDFEYHLTTLFPPVRPRGWLELRYIDALPDPWWQVPVVVATCLLDDDEASAAAAEAVARCGASWLDAARCGPSHPELARAAETCFDAALGACSRLGVDELTVEVVARYRDLYVARHRCPADDRLDEWAASDGPVEPPLAASWT